MNSHKKILIIGSGQAAIYAASEFRKYDKDSTVTIFGNENYHPYDPSFVPDRKLPKSV
tara:strand:+ start:157 stop:330 length:174 start_codon:yes stop_codon:yes gene_type:complete